MKVTIRKLDNTEREYFAYVKSLCGKATYFLYFEDTVWGAVTLYNFIEMLKSFFQQKEVEIIIAEECVTLKNQSILELMKE